MEIYKVPHRQILESYIGLYMVFSSAGWGPGAPKCMLRCEEGDHASPPHTRARAAAAVRPTEPGRARVRVRV